METKDVFEDFRRGQGAENSTHSKDKTYFSERVLPDESTAQEALEQARDKLFAVNQWSDLPGFTATFELHDSAGAPKPTGKVQVGDYIRIELPGPAPENWVNVVDSQTEATSAQFTVRPSSDPRASAEDQQKTEHFFKEKATSTFRVELNGSTLTAYEIGRDEEINNEGEEAGNRGLINTVVAEAGRLFFQEMQWQKLTDYLVHL